MTEFPWVLLAFAATVLATGSMVVSLARTSEPISTVLRRWGSRLSDVFWSLG